MKLLFDASALLNLTRRLGGDSLRHFRDNYILTLTPYEVANALWKEAVLLRRISLGEAETILTSISAVYKLMEVVEPLDRALSLRLAYALGLTYYDASYVVASHERGARLVTDDKKLQIRLRNQRSKVRELLGKEPPLIQSIDIV